MKIRLFVVALAFSAASFNTCFGVDDDLTNLLSSGNWARIKDNVCCCDEPFDRAENIIVGYAGLATGDYRLAMKGFSQAPDGVSYQSNNCFFDHAEFTSNKKSERWILWILQADRLVRLGRYKQAIAAVSKAIELNPSAAIVHDLRGTIRMLADDDNSALQDLECTIKIDPALADAYVVRGIILLRQERPVEAQQEFEQALRIVPDFAVAANARGVALCKQSQYDKSLQVFAFAQDLAPNFVVAKRNVDLTRELTSVSRTHVRLGIPTGRWKGVIGCRLVAPVVTSSDDRESAISKEWPNGTLQRKEMNMKTLYSDHRFVALVAVFFLAGCAANGTSSAEKSQAGESRALTSSELPASSGWTENLIPCIRSMDFGLTLQPGQDVSRDDVDNINTTFWINTEECRTALAKWASSLGGDEKKIKSLLEEVHRKLGVESIVPRKFFKRDEVPGLFENDR